MGEINWPKKKFFSDMDSLGSKNKKERKKKKKKHIKRLTFQLFSFRLSCSDTSLFRITRYNSPLNNQQIIKDALRFI